MKILLISRSGIGDMIMVTPALKSLRATFPKADITLLGPKSSYEVVRGTNLVDKHIDFHSVLTAGIFKTLKVLHRIRKSRFDISLTAVDSANKESVLLCKLGKVKKSIGHRLKEVPLTRKYDRSIPFNTKIHIVESNLALAKAAGAKKLDRKPVVIVSKADIRHAETFVSQKFGRKRKGPLVGVHTGSGGHTWKRWPVQNFRKLMNDMVVKGYDVMTFYGPEESRLDGLDKRIVVVENKPYKQVAAIIGMCDAFVSNDSGLMHTATGREVKTIGLFGPSNACWTSPYGKEHTVLKKDLWCSPCYVQLGWTFKCKNKVFKRCLKSITPQMVLNSVEKAVKKTKK